MPLVRSRWQLDNHLGSSSIELNDNAQVISYEEYHPFGSTSFHTVDTGAEVSAKRYRYTGKERDDETGLYYYGARYYASWLGRWLSTDPSVEDGWNLYVYVRANPIKLNDPNGNASIETDATSVKLPLIAPETPKIPNPLKNQKSDSGPVLRAYDPQREAIGREIASYNQAVAEGLARSIADPFFALGSGPTMLLTKDQWLSNRVGAGTSLTLSTAGGMGIGGRGLGAEALVREAMAKTYSPSVTMQNRELKQAIKAPISKPSLSKNLIQLPQTDIKQDITIRIANKKIEYGSSDLSQRAIQFRKENNIFGGVNVFVFEYKTADGNLNYITSNSQRGIGHAERINATALDKLGIQPSQVTRIYSELEPCSVPGGYCKDFISRTYPNANVSYSFEYGQTQESRRAGVEELKMSILNNIKKEHK